MLIFSNCPVQKCAHPVVPALSLGALASRSLCVLFRTAGMGPSSLQLRLRVQQLRWKRFAGSWVIHKRRVILGFFYPLLFVLSFLHHMLVGSRKTGFPILPVTGLCASALKGCLCAIVAVSSFSLVRRLFPVPLLSLSSPPTTFLPCARIQPPEPAAGSPWELC